jgi:RNA polymerase primary sigma factor
MSSDLGDPALEAYLKDIRRYPLLSADEEKAIAREIQSGSWDAWEARDRMIRSNLRLVIAVAKRYRKRGMPLADLIEEGNVGLVHAVEKFDPEMDTRFSTYATWWIRQAVRRSIQNKVRTVRIPPYLSDELNRWRRFARDFEKREGRIPAEAELLDGMKPIPGRRKLLLRLHHALSEGGQTVSLDVLFEATESLVDPRAARPDLIDFGSMERERLLEAIDQLPEREARIIRYRFGLTEEGRSLTLRHIASEMDMSRERVRQLEHKALETLRRSFDASPRRGRDR